MMRDKYEKRLEEYESEFASVHVAMAHRKTLKEFIPMLKNPPEGIEVIVGIRTSEDAPASSYTLPRSQYKALAETLSSCQKEVEILLDTLLFEGVNG